MSNNRMIFIGEKESFIARVLMKKVNDTGAECVFVPWTIKEINANIEDASLIALYMDAGIRPDDDIIHFISDKLEEYSHQIIIIGEQEDTEHIRAHFPGEHVYMTFSRPVDNKRFAEAVTEYFEKADLGMFKRSILIVDDDPQYLTMVREWLKGTYKVAMANSGLQAIKWLGKNKVDLILLDHEMPVTSGPQVLEMLRSDEETRSIPVMFLTGKRDKESVMAVVALRPEGYFLKDIKKDELLEKLGEFFILHK